MTAQIYISRETTGAGANFQRIAKRHQKPPRRSKPFAEAKPKAADFCGFLYLISTDSAAQDISGNKSGYKLHRQQTEGAKATGFREERASPIKARSKASCNGGSMP
ncbi:MAG: hypothetical protein EOP62_02920 [Sphingomonadales bacterium]|nr:MAG: hypothetical protein EOP62_02920 [Sphingomonadales bacterium]